MWPFLKKHTLWFAGRITRDRLDSSAAHGAFFLIISFLPFLAFLLTLMQIIHFSSGVTMIEAALDLLPAGISTALSALIPSPIVASGVLPLAVVTALWSSSTGMAAVIKGLDQVYEVKEPRSFILQRAMAVLYVALLAVALIAAALLLVFGSTIYRFLLERWPTLAALLINFKSLAGFVLLFLFFTLLYSFVPRRRIKFRHNLAGAAFGAGGWVLFSYFFSLFVENFSNFSIYGSLATLVILMFWLFFCMYILFLGGEVSMWLATSGVLQDFRALCRGKPKKYRVKRSRAGAARPAAESRTASTVPADKENK